MGLVNKAYAGEDCDLLYQDSISRDVDCPVIVLLDLMDPMSNEMAIMMEAIPSDLAKKTCELAESDGEPLTLTFDMSRRDALAMFANVSGEDRGPLDSPLSEDEYLLAVFGADSFQFRKRPTTSVSCARQTRTRPSGDPLDTEQLLGTWRTQDYGGGGVPSWSELTYHADGTVTRRDFVGELGEIEQWKVETYPYRLDGNDLFMKPNEAGEYDDPFVIRISGDRMYYEFKISGEGSYWTKVN